MLRLCGVFATPNYFFALMPLSLVDNVDNADVTRGHSCNCAYTHNSGWTEKASLAYWRKPKGLPSEFCLWKRISRIRRQGDHCWRSRTPIVSSSIKDFELTGRWRFALRAAASFWTACVHGYLSRCLSRTRIGHSASIQHQCVAEHQPDQGVDHG